MAEGRNEIRLHLVDLTWSSPVLTQPREADSQLRIAIKAFLNSAEYEGRDEEAWLQNSEAMRRHNKVLEVGEVYPQHDLLVVAGGGTVGTD